MSSQFLSKHPSISPGSLSELLGHINFWIHFLKVLTDDLRRPILFIGFNLALRLAASEHIGESRGVLWQ